MITIGIHTRVVITPVYRTPCRIGMCTSLLHLAPPLMSSAANLPEQRLWLEHESQKDLIMRPAASITMGVNGATKRVRRGLMPLDIGLKLERGAHRYSVEKDDPTAPHPLDIITWMQEDRESNNRAPAPGSPD